MKLEVNGISKKIDHKDIFQNISFILDKGHISAVVGSNGSGKTSIFRSIISNYYLDNGMVLFNDSIKHSNRKIFNSIGISTQESRMYPKLSILENIEFYKSFYNIEIHSNFNDDFYISKLQLKSFLNIQYSKLSTGNRQKSDLLRSLVINPELIIWDEPFANVDLESRLNIIDLMLEMKNGLKTSFLISTHNFQSISSIIDSLLILSDGKVTFSGTIKELIKLNTLQKSKGKFDYLLGEYSDSKNIEV